MNLLVSSEEVAIYMAKKFGVPDNLIRDVEQRRQLVQLAQQFAQQPEQIEGAMNGTPPLA